MSKDRHLSPTGITDGVIWEQLLLFFFPIVLLGLIHGEYKPKHALVFAAAYLVTMIPALLAGRPFILETPNDDAGYAREIAMIKSWADESME